MEYSPLTYYTLGTVYPRVATRRPYPRRRRRLAIPVISPRRPHVPGAPTSCTVAPRGLAGRIGPAGIACTLRPRGLVCELVLEE